ncbi:uncharacterized protein BKA55DRAFT_553786 [Fusarium redolens]|uniref:Uncharacterized protein n=1 Tax=Fusarium redolens TaxID=48865 RepID=A0A9P9R4Y0_FUSRE|nr:uncharacterized protein BKA55DRAFT_553786 [Fusarium redolens]KAH7266932.1 hypothetical protein BKA55DRAFT_553786 [Fusarium redolens]
MARTKEDVASKDDASPRIPKSSAGVTKNTAEAPVKRGRGRPPKGAAPMPKKVYVPTGRPRGRPPGSGKKKTGPKKVAAVNDDGTPKQGRGRPRRAASGTESAATTPMDGKKRGRKPKAADVSDDEETKHDEPADEDAAADESPAKDEAHDEDGEDSD